MPPHQVKNCSRPETLSVATVLTDADRAMYHALELGFETMRDLGPAVSISGGATPVGDPDHELAELGALGGLAADAIPRPTASSARWSCSPA